MKRRRERGKERREGLSRGAEQIGRRGLGAEVLSEGAGVRMPRAEGEGEKMEEGAGGGCWGVGTDGGLVLGCPPPVSHPLAVQRREAAPGGPMASPGPHGRRGAEGAVGQLQGGGKTEWRSLCLVRQVRGSKSVKERRVERRLVPRLNSTSAHLSRGGSQKDGLG